MQRYSCTRATPNETGALSPRLCRALKMKDSLATLAVIQNGSAWIEIQKTRVARQRRDCDWARRRDSNPRAISAANCRQATFEGSGIVEGIAIRSNREDHSQILRFVSSLICEGFVGRVWSAAFMPGRFPCLCRSGATKIGECRHRSLKGVCNQVNGVSRLQKPRSESLTSCFYAKLAGFFLG